MRILVESDHAGFALESRVVLRGSGAGVSIAADKVAGVRAFLGTDFEGGRHGRRADQTADIERRSK